MSKREGRAKTIATAEDAIGVFCRSECAEWNRGRDCGRETCPLYFWSPCGFGEADQRWIYAEIARRAKVLRDKRRRGND